jgi:hypothetical protein
VSCSLTSPAGRLWLGVGGGGRGRAGRPRPPRNRALAWYLLVMSPRPSTGGPHEPDELEGGSHGPTVALGPVAADRPSGPSVPTAVAAPGAPSDGRSGLWWRRRWPVELALVLVALATFSEVVAGAMVVALFSVAIHRPRGPPRPSTPSACWPRSSTCWCGPSPGASAGPVPVRHRGPGGRGRLGPVHPLPAPAGAVTARPGGPRRDRGPAAGRAGPAAHPRRDRPRDARRARPPAVAAERARRRPRVPPRRPAGGDRPRGQGGQGERPPGAPGPARGHRRPAGPGRRAAPAHSGRRPAARRRVGPGRDAGPPRRGGRRRRPRPARPHRLPDRPGGPDQRPQARPRRRGAGPPGRVARRGPHRRGLQRGPRDRARPWPGAGSRPQARAGAGVGRAGRPGRRPPGARPTAGGGWRLVAWLPWRT